jgi:hypothetical protein
MTHRQYQLHEIDTTLWQQVDIHALSPGQRAIFTFHYACRLAFLQLFK